MKAIILQSINGNYEAPYRFYKYSDEQTLNQLESEEFRSEQVRRKLNEREQYWNYVFETEDLTKQ